MKTHPAKKFTALILSILMLLALMPTGIPMAATATTAVDTTAATATTAAAAAGTPIIEYFKNPDENSRPMARMWFPDASSGADENDVIEKQIFALAEK